MITVIGDVHGKQQVYLDIVNSCDYSVQVGDFGFNYSCFSIIDSDRHKFIHGNHDNLDWLDLHSPPNYLGRFGYTSLNNISFFFISGGFSIDKKQRLLHQNRFDQTWWGQEELSYKEGVDCLEQYGKIRPDLVIAHTCPSEIAKHIGNPGILKYHGFDSQSFKTSQQVLLQDLINIHKPSLFIHGHFHKSYCLDLNGIEFIGLAELETYELG